MCMNCKFDGNLLLTTKKEELQRLLVQHLSKKTPKKPILMQLDPNNYDLM